MSDIEDRLREIEARIASLHETTTWANVTTKSQTAEQLSHVDAAWLVAQVRALVKDLHIARDLVRRADTIIAGLLIDGDQLGEDLNDIDEWIADSRETISAALGEE